MQSLARHTWPGIHGPASQLIPKPLLPSRPSEILTAATLSSTLNRPPRGSRSVTDPRSSLSNSPQLRGNSRYIYLSLIIMSMVQSDPFFVLFVEDVEFRNHHPRDFSL